MSFDFCCKLNVMSQTERILFIDRKLRNTGYFTADEVAREFEVSTRQVKRDIEYMRERFEAPVLWVRREKHYVYEKPFKHLEFADQHLVLSYLSVQSMLKNASYFPAVSDELLNSFKSLIPKEFAGVCDRIFYQLPSTDVLKPEFFTMICSALKQKRCLEIVYLNTKNEESSRKVEPFYLINYGGSWYVICFDYLRRDIRTFHVSRMKKMILSDEPVQNRGEEFQKKIEKYRESGFGIFYGEKTLSVKIEFTGEAAGIVRTQVWHENQILEAAENAGCSAEKVVLTFPAANLTEVLSKTLGFGSYAKPLEPPELVEKWKSEIQKLGRMASLF